MLKNITETYQFLKIETLKSCTLIIYRSSFLTSSAKENVRLASFFILEMDNPKRLHYI